MTRISSKIIYVFIAILLLLSVPATAQDSATVHWLSFEELEDSLTIKPKIVFINFYTDWCAYCRKMDKEVFTNPEVIEILNGHYYAVRFDAETDSSVTFGGQEFINDQIGKSRTPLHQITRMLALRKGRFVAPTLVILDEEFNVTSRYFSFLDSRNLVRALE